MHKFVLKIFDFLKNLAQFLQIIVLFCILFFLLFWIQNLIGQTWGWLGFFSPFAKIILALGSSVSTAAIELFDASFEFKYFIALLFLTLMYYILHLLTLGLDSFEAFYKEKRMEIKQFNEYKLNKQLAREQKNEQTRIKYYKIYVSTSIKKKFSHKELNINIEEQNKMMIKFLSDKIGIMPEKYEGGFLFSFSSFDKIDNNLDIFFKLLKSTAPLDYLICVQIFGHDLQAEENKLKTLIKLNLINKISMLAETSYRYKFNATHRYSTNQLGLYQKDGGTCEVYEFTEI